jgi:hypothetical protein
MRAASRAIAVVREESIRLAEKLVAEHPEVLDARPWRARRRQAPLGAPGECACPPRDASAARARRARSVSIPPTRATACAHRLRLRPRVM